MKFGIALVLAAFLLLLLFQAYSFYRKGEQASLRGEELRVELERAEQDALRLKADYDYYEEPANLEKELRSRFNYRGVGEKTIVIIPPRAATSTATP